MSRKLNEAKLKAKDYDQLKDHKQLLESENHRLIKERTDFLNQWISTP